MSITASPTLAELQGRVRGRVVRPSDDDYDQRRTVFYNVARRPGAVVMAADADDVARTVRIAREEGTDLAVRSGGHSLVGHSSVDDGIVLDLSGLDEISIDVEGRSAWVGAGVTAGAFTTRAAEHGLGVGFGDTGSVGIPGITLGGGVGFLSRLHGLTIDSLLAVDVVTADGELVRADADSHPDLFWALRGGGGNFGVVTRLRFRLHDISSAFGGMFVLPATPEVVAGFVEVAHDAPEALSTIANVMTAPPAPFVPPELVGELILFSTIVHLGPHEAGEQAVAPFRALATPLLDQLGPMSYPSVYPPEEGDFHPSAAGHTLFRDDFSRDEAAFVVEHVRAGTAAMNAVQLRVLGGAVSRVPADATAYAHRAHPLMLNVAAMAEDPAALEQHRSWLDAGDAALHQDGVDGRYVNFLGSDTPEQVRAAYPGATWDRLRAIKRRYDPDNVFRVNYNIPPADSD
ncbi:MAG TPA: FAD-binding oxidoreductase [Egibacteraceae bacterium]